MEDEAILELFFARSEQGITELDAKYGALCRSLAYNILGRREDAAECVNDAYLGAWQAIPPERPERLRAWLCRVVRNISLARRRKNTADKRGAAFDVALSELEDALASPGEVGDELDAKELARMLEGFLDTLSAQNRAIFVRRYWFADSCAAIATHVGISEGNVTVRLTRLRRALRKYLEERGVYV